ncbi:phage major tail tube protein [Rhizobium rhizoryzae]|uniref:Phage tail protein n=1 Tax=Rhizobium rhizoryzae TaxID=451876 RepID=A0A7W6PS12_9HYPH|nr:phage major tail tube protein [Rhizobium rhizoryzae]MBB4145825.1 hypothetical protein [Rhizobium rhizoryzae]
MAQKPFLVMTMVDFRRSSAAEDSRTTILEKVVLGGFKFKTVSRSAGGSVMDVDYYIPKLEPVELSIGVNGFDQDLMPGIQDRWTMAAAMRDSKGRRIPVRLEVEGVIVEWSPDEASPAEFKGCNSAIKQITHIDLNIDGKPWFYADHQESEIRRLGISLTAEDRAAAGI